MEGSLSGQRASRYTRSEMVKRNRREFEQKRTLKRRETLKQRSRGYVLIRRESWKRDACERASNCGLRKSGIDRGKPRSCKLSELPGSNREKSFGCARRGMQRVGVFRPSLPRNTLCNVSNDPNFRPAPFFAHRAVVHGRGINSPLVSLLIASKGSGGRTRDRSDRGC